MSFSCPLGQYSKDETASFLFAFPSSCELLLIRRAKLVCLRLLLQDKSLMLARRKEREMLTFPFSYMYFGRLHITKGNNLLFTKNKYLVKWLYPRDFTINVKNLSTLNFAWQIWKRCQSRRIFFFLFSRFCNILLRWSRKKFK